MTAPPPEPRPVATPPLDALAQTAARSMGWVVVDRWGTRFASLLTMIVLGRLLAPNDFGLIALASLFISFAGIFVDQGFGKALVQREVLRADHIDTAFWAAVIMAGILTTLIVLAAPLLAAGAQSRDIVPILRWLALGLLLDSLAATPMALLEREFRFKSLAIRRVVSTVAGGAAGIGCAFAGYGVWSLVAQQLVSGVVGLIVLWSATRWRPRGGPKRIALRELWPMGFGVLGIELLGFFGSQSDRLLVGAFLGTQALGCYFMAMRIVGIMVEIFASIFSAVSLTTFSRLQNDLGRLREWLYRLTGASSAVTLPCFALAAALAPVLFPFVLGEQWLPSVPVFQILALLGAINSVAYFDRSVLLATGKAREALLLTLGQSLVGVVLVLLAAPHGVLAVAVAVVARQYVYWPARLYVLRAAIGIQPRRYLAQWVRPFVAALAVSAIVYAVVWHWPPTMLAALTYLAVGSVLGFALYLLTLRVVHPRLFVDLRTMLRQLRARSA